jgi:uncharacterized protein
MNAQISWLQPNRLHLHHGPIDCIIEATGDARDVERALRAAAAQFPTILPELVSNLTNLRSKLGTFTPQVSGETAARMVHACWPHRAQFITPMAAVAGSVADTLLARMLECAPALSKAFVNNGGDIALHIAAEETFALAVAPDPNVLRGNAVISIPSSWGVRGAATSGWRGRSHSLGIADAVTVLSSTAASADAAATMIANAVNVKDESIVRKPAHEVKDDSDLGDLLVTVDVPPLAESKIAEALNAGERAAQLLVSSGLIHSAVLQCQGRIRLVHPTSVVHQTPQLTLLAA